LRGRPRGNPLAIVNDHSIDTTTGIGSPAHWDFETPAKSQTRKQPAGTTGIERVRQPVELPFCRSFVNLIGAPRLPENRGVPGSSPGLAIGE
jgi:hypothetical protein